MTRNTLLIGLDGATYALLDPLMDAGVMPFLQSFILGGVRANLRTIIPPLTPPAWTSLLTGRTPGHHGIFDFFQLETPSGRRIRLATSKDVRSPTVANIVNQAGLQATVLNFPAHFPPPAIDGAVVAGWMPWKQLRLGCYPDNLFEQLKALPGFNARELAMDMAQEASATEGSGEEGQIEWAELHARREEHWGEVVTYLMQQRPTALTAILLDGPDKVQHLSWRFLDPELATNLTPEEQQIRHSCLNFYRRLDAVLRDIISSTTPETTVVLASDHGFGATTEVFHINTWLEQAGYLAWSDGMAANTSTDSILGMRHLTRHTDWIDWQKTKAYASTPTGNGIHIVVAEENDGFGVPRHQYAQFRQELRQALLRFNAPGDGTPIVTEAWTREDIFPGEASAYGPDLTLTLRDGGLVSILPATQTLEPRPRPAGTHRPIGMFAARGPGIKRGIRTGELSILDVAPMLLYSLGVAVPSELEGRVPLEIYDVAFRAKHRAIVAPLGTRGRANVAARAPEPATVSVGKEQATLDASSETAGATLDDDGEATIMARLRSLGYIS